jgi:CHAD domain-containing protein
MNYLKSVLRKRSLSFFSSLEKARGNGDVESIHQLRVNIKKIRAVIHFLEISGGGKRNPGMTSILKPLFKNAGTVREIQVNKSLLKSYHLPVHALSDYNAFLESEEKTAISVFHQELAYARQERLKKKISTFRKNLSSPPNKEIRKNAEAYLQKHLLKIQKLLDLPLHEEDIHLIRKYLKAMDPIMGILYRLNEESKFRRLQAGIRQIGIELGNWHDRIILLSSLEQFLHSAKYLSQSKLLILVKLADQIRKETASLSKELKPALLKINY